MIKESPLKVKLHFGRVVIIFLEKTLSTISLIAIYIPACKSVSQLFLSCQQIGSISYLGKIRSFPMLLSGYFLYAIFLQPFFKRPCSPCHYFFLSNSSGILLWSCTSGPHFSTKIKFSIVLNSQMALPSFKYIFSLPSNSVFSHINLPPSLSCCSS